MPSWHSLPAELHLMIFDILADCGCVSSCAAVCKEWQAILEKRIFRRLSLGPTCLRDLDDMVTHRTRPLVQHIWLHIELPRYTCKICNRSEAISSWEKCNTRIRSAIWRLFSILESWGPALSLTLELSVDSPSDSEHHFKNYCFAHRDPGVQRWDDDSHGWSAGRQYRLPAVTGIDRLFGGVIDLRTRVQLSRVEAITTLVIRRQVRRRLPGFGLILLIRSLPRLECLVFEPWRQWDPECQLTSDQGWELMFRGGLPSTLKRISIFEDFDESHMRQIRAGTWMPDLNRRGYQELGAQIARQSMRFTHLSVSFMTDAVQFFRSPYDTRTRPQLEFLSLTSICLNPCTPPAKIGRLLRMAAYSAARMPRLQHMVLWNYRNRNTCAFTYSRRDESISWCGTWDFEFDEGVEKDWQLIVSRATGGQLRTATRKLDKFRIRSHGDAIHELGLPSGIIDAESLRQIRQEGMRMLSDDAG